MTTQYEYLCGGCRTRFESQQGQTAEAVCPRCDHHAATLTALIVNGRRRTAVASLVAYQGGQRWLGGCCSG
jgi:DNA-directed RNA polymerase subunit RPC12/RpoP